MIWPPAAVYGFVRAAGFRTEQWARATALAIATSGGDDLYRDVSHPGPAVDRRGLFGIDVVRFAEFSGDDLLDPRTNCRAAYALTVGYDGGFGWSAVPVPTPTSPAFLAAAGAVRGGPVPMPLTSGLGSPSPALGNRRTIEQLAGISDYVRSRLRARG